MLVGLKNGRFCHIQVGVTGSTDKAYSIDFTNRDSYLHAIVSGQKVTRQIALDYWREIIDQCEASSCSKILLEHAFEEMISMPEMLQVIGPVTEMLQGRLLAFYDRYGNYDIPEAGKKIMRSHDVKMQIFEDLDQAERWLLAN
jgi:hypothetical protein